MGWAVNLWLSERLSVINKPDNHNTSMEPSASCKHL